MRRAIVLFAALMAVSPVRAQQQRYALIDAAGNVVNVVVADPSYPPPLGFTLVQSDAAAPGWKWSPTGGFVAPAVAKPLLENAMQVVSSSTPALNGYYSTDPATQQKVQAISLYISVNGKFPAGQAAMPWPDANGAMHQFQTTAQWQAFATAMGDFVAAVDLGQTPVQPVTIP
jgi:hypothetical protein